MKPMLRAAVLFAVVFASPWPAQAADKTVVGWIENVTVNSEPMILPAKVDTGAQTSSLHCDCITPIEKDGEQWVQFGITGLDGKSVRLRRKVERIARIKTHKGESSERMVVRIGVCLANTYREVEVTLVDRSKYQYAMLVGRNFLEGQFIVDPGATNLTQPSCKAQR
jgi:hypothetical protein